MRGAVNLDYICKFCNIKVKEGRSWWDFTGSNYNTLLATCPYCGKLNILGYEELPDRTAWYYEYRRK